MNIREKIANILYSNPVPDGKIDQLESLFKEEFKRIVKEAKPSHYQVYGVDYKHEWEGRLALDQYEQSLIQKITEI